MKTNRINATPERARDRSATRVSAPRRAPRDKTTAEALVTDPERLLAALESSEETEEPRTPRARARMASGVREIGLLADVERDHAPALRDDETAVRTACGAFVVRRRRASDRAA